MNFSYFVDSNTFLRWFIFRSVIKSHYIAHNLNQTIMASTLTITDDETDPLADPSPSPGSNSNSVTVGWKMSQPVKRVATSDASDPPSSR